MFRIFFTINIVCTKFTVTNAYNNDNIIGSIADYDPIKKQQSYNSVKYTDSSETQNFNLGVCIYLLAIIYFYGYSLLLFFFFLESLPSYVRL